ncbi:MAG TPA: alpha/beta fold hydrolase [Candidatus Acidoferrales bacterium]|nr:alpha/beta fold hydrolase [Candidatus Acidoferrales bacterium]
MIGSVPLEEFSYGLDLSGADPAALTEALRAVTLEVMSDPVRLGTIASGLLLAQQSIAMNAFRRMQGETPEPAGNIAGDKRFNDPAWTSNPFLLSMVEEYLVRRQHAQQIIELSRLPESTKRKARFALTMLMDAIAPSNLPWLNPSVLKEAVNTGGASLIEGLTEMLDDVENNGGYPKQVDTSGFELGVNMAATPGEIVFRNELIELIAYTPQTQTVYERPILMSPPWINKYYIMDISPGRSFVEWAVSRGHQVFMISYRNPDASMRDYTMDTYFERGLLAALEAVERLTGAPQVNVAALCLGGTMTTMMLAYLAAKGEAHRVGAVTLTNTIVDFAEPGDLGVFTDEGTIARLEEQMNETGYLDSSEMAHTFDWMRANDLIWSYVVSNWYMGKKPPAFDILAWNADATRMPAAMHSQYLRACYLHNLLVVPNAFVLGGVPIDLGTIATPLYILGAEADHIAPWRTSYMTSQYVCGPVTYTRSNSGHVAGICNPPGNPKACYWTNDRTEPGESADAWLARSSKYQGTWWENWAQWADAHGGARRAPYQLPSSGEPAPGRYVRNETAQPFNFTTTEHEATTV